MEKEKLKKERWETICSDLKELYFFSLVDTGDLIFTVRDDRYKYEFTFHKPGPYMVVNEALRSSELFEPGLSAGWTRIITNSDLKPMFVQDMLEIYYDNKTLKHYNIGSYDACLEILSSEEPVIKRYSIDVD